MLNIDGKYYGNLDGEASGRSAEVLQWAAAARLRDVRMAIRGDDFNQALALSDALNEDIWTDTDNGYRLYHWLPETDQDEVRTVTRRLVAMTER